MGADNRKSPRHQATVKIALKSLDLQQFHELYTQNVGTGGVFVRAKQLLPIGTQVRFEILCSGKQEPLVGTATVSWVRQFDPNHPDVAAGMGLQFTELSETSAALFEQLAAVANEPIEKLFNFAEMMQEVEAALPPSALPASNTDSADAALDEPLDLGEPMALGEPLPEEGAGAVQEFADDHVHLGESTLGKGAGGVGEAMMTLPTSYSVLDTVLGIDLGTSNSCVAVIKDGAPFVIAHEKDEKTVPSVVFFTKKGEIIVGKQAKEQLCIDPKNTIYGAKRFIGRPYNSPTVHNLKDAFPYDIIPGEKGQVALQVRGEVMNLETISSHILSYLKHVGQEFVDLEVTKAIITVPAYYNDNQRQAVKEAGRMAGLDVLRIVNEPTAAALAYGFNRGYKTKILVYDLGGGTFDVSLLELAGNSFEVLACGGNNFLGGEDFDNAITDHLIQTYEKEQKVKIGPERVVRERIKQAAEFAKRQLSETLQTTINVPYIKSVDGKNLNMQLTLTRETLNKITMHLVKRTVQICDDVLYGIGLGKGDLEDVILVGGQTRMPLVRHTIHQHFAKAPRTDINPDEVVAMGAALLGAGLKQSQSLKLRDTISISIGIALPGGRFKQIIKSNTPVPITKSYKIGARRATPEAFHIDVFQGESNFVHENEYLGTLLFSDLPVGQSDDIKMNIEFRVTEECILKVTATHPESGRTEEALLVTYDTPPSLKQAQIQV